MQEAEMLRFEVRLPRRTVRFRRKHLGTVLALLGEVLLRLQLLPQQMPEGRHRWNCERESGLKKVPKNTVLIRTLKKNRVTLKP